jgi:SAM-dependent methyltransferase
MKTTEKIPAESSEPRPAYGRKGFSILDRLGIALSCRALFKYWPFQQSVDVLDVGCGYEAVLMQRLRPRIQRGVGIDFKVNPDLSAGEGLRFLNGDAVSLLPTLPAASFDVVIMNSVLEHFWDPQILLDESYRLLRSPGWLFVNVPTWRGKRFLEFSAFRLGLSPRVEMEDHKMYYDRRDLWPMLVRAAFLPSRIHMRYHKLGMNLFAWAEKQ